MSIEATAIREAVQYNPDTGAMMWRCRPELAFSNPRFAKGWNTRFAGKAAFNTPDGQGYLRGRLDGVDIRAHQIAWVCHYGRWPNGQIDHINGNRADNRISNLREVTHQENAKNQKLRADNKSGAAGVRYVAALRKWRADIAKKYIGVYDTKQAAISARRNIEKQMNYNENHGLQKGTA